MSTSLPESPAQPPVQLEQQLGFTSTRVCRGRVCEHHITLWHERGEPVAMMFWRLDSYLRKNDAQVVKHEVFGDLNIRSATLANVSRLQGGLNWPVSWVEGRSCSGAAVAGMHVLAVSGAQVETIYQLDRTVGRAYDDGLARHLFLADLYPGDITASRPAQAEQVFGELQKALALGRMNMTNLARTWVFIDDILSWYGPFNVVRKAVFEAAHVGAELLPASTGVGVKNVHHGALVVSAWGVTPHNSVFSVRELQSPLQCAAPRYGSCFSRAVELTAPGTRQLIISGTASIDEGGESIHVDDIEGQIAHTMSVVDALLQSRNMNHSNVTRATLYFKEARHAPAFLAWSRSAEPAFPAVIVQADICRPELLFEVELDAVASTEE